MINNCGDIFTLYFLCTWQELNFQFIHFAKHVNINIISNSSVAEEPPVPVLAGEIIGGGLSHHPGDELLLLELEPVEILLGPGEPGYCEHHVLVYEAGGVVEADPAEGPHPGRHQHLHSTALTCSSLF